MPLEISFPFSDAWSQIPNAFYLGPSAANSGKQTGFKICVLRQRPIGGVSEISPVKHPGRCVKRTARKAADSIITVSNT